MSRGYESGMEFEYDNRTGPLDARSPFAQLSQNTQRFPGTPVRQSAWTPCDALGDWDVNMDGTGNPSALNSPSKHITSRHTSPNKPLPPKPSAFNAMFSTPRKVKTEIDDSSAGETPKSPEQTDNDPATPDTLGRSGLIKFEDMSMNAHTGAERERQRKTPVREKRPQPSARRESFLVALTRKGWSKFSSPGRGEISGPKHSGGIEKAKKRREQGLQRHESRRRRHSMSEDSAEDSELPRPRSPRKVSRKHHDDPPENSEKKQNWISSTFSFIAKHPTVPHILSWYAQLIFNVFLLAAFSYLIYCFWSAVQGDVDKKSFEAIAEIIAEKEACLHKYTENRCERGSRVPAMEKMCDDWALCMNRDASKVARAKVSAHTFAEIFNSFVEPISWKAMIFTCLLVFGSFATTNMVFAIFRDKAQHAQPNYYQPPPPPTPQRTFSGGEGQFYGTPWHQPHPGLEPMPSGAYGQIEGRGSPVRKIAYN